MKKEEYTLTQLAAIYTVYKDINLNRTINCCSCGKTIFINSLEDCYNYFGHYISRSKEPKLKLNPYNIHAQCVNCNMNPTKQTKTNYDNYMIYRYGKDIKNKLLNDDSVYGLEFYMIELYKLSDKFFELKSIFNSDSNRKFIEEYNDCNDIEKQWNTYSITYKQDLDVIARALNLKENFEYERL